MGSNTDEWIAAMASYVRSSFGNAGGMVTPADVARVRAATASRKNPWTLKELEPTLPRRIEGQAAWKLTASHSPVYVSPDQVPTWLYQAVHLTGPVRAMSEDELAEQIETLSAKFEERLLPKKPWLSSKMTAGRLEALKKAIVGLEMTVEEVEGSFKLNQHKSETDYAAIAGSLAAQADAGAQQIAHLMREARPNAFANQEAFANETNQLERSVP